MLITISYAYFQSNGWSAGVGVHPHLASVELVYVLARSFFSALNMHCCRICSPIILPVPHVSHVGWASLKFFEQMVPRSFVTCADLTSCSSARMLVVSNIFFLIAKVFFCLFVLECFFLSQIYPSHMPCLYE